MRLLVGAPFLATLLAAATLAGCIGGDESLETSGDSEIIYIPNRSPRLPAPVQNETENATEPVANETPAAEEAPELVLKPLPRIETFVFPGSIVAGASAATGDLAPRVASGEGLSEAFEVGEGAVAIVAELAWTSDIDLDLYVRGPGYSEATPLGTPSEGPVFSDTEGDPLKGDAPARVLVSDLAGLLGEWSYEVRAKAAADTDFTVYVSVFYHGGDPARHSAIPPYAL